jgi:hypothetical protein
MQRLYECVYHHAYTQQWLLLHTHAAIAGCTCTAAAAPLLTTHSLYKQTFNRQQPSTLGSGVNVAHTGSLAVAS